MKRKLTSAILTTLSVLLIGCGGGGAPTISEKDKALTKIAAYATGSSSEKPGIEDYHDAGIFEANNNNINALNEYVRDTESSHLEDWIEDSDGDGVIDAIDGAPDDALKSNNRPVAVSEQISVVYKTANRITLKASDIDGDRLHYTRISSPSHGTLSGTEPNLTYTSEKGYIGDVNFKFEVSDEKDNPVIATITIKVIPDPTAIAKIADYATGKSAEKPSTKNYHDIGMEVAESYNINAINEYVRNTRSSSLGDWTEDSDGDGVINAIDGAPDDASKSNNKPLVTDRQKCAVSEESTEIILSASDIDGDALSYNITSEPTHGVLNDDAAPRLIYTSNDNYTGDDSFKFKVSDAEENSIVATITIHVVADNPDIICISEEYQAESLGKGSNLQKTITLGSTPKNLYVLLTNSDEYEDSDPTITHNAKVTPVKKNRKIHSNTITSTQHRILHAPAHITHFGKDRSRLHKRVGAKRGKLLPAATRHSKDISGDKKEFYLDARNTSNKTAATAKKVVTVSTTFGEKTLNIWVSDDSFGSRCEKETCITQTMVNNLADTFLKAGSNNDIYDWVTNIYGEEWGDYAADTYSNLIGADDEITILLTDIDNDNSKNGGTMGYFYPKDNYTTSTNSGSNKRVMFYIDSVMYANTENEGYWQKETYSTLAHEFTHMIEFYQKFVIRDSEHDIWIAEMLAETTEDLVATKIRHNGPRNVAYTDGSAGDPDNVNGRYPDFAKDPTLSLTAWNFAIEDYSKVSAFGTFLTRNYGGAKVLHDIMYTTKEHTDLIESVTGKSFAVLLREWGVAVMLSDIESPEDLPTYNTGDFTEDHYGNSTYQLGSINFFNYIPKPVTKTTTGTVKAEGNYYYKIGENLTGNITVDIKLDTGTEATLIAK